MRQTPDARRHDHANGETALWVIVDDGSTDDLPAIMAENAEKYDRIRVITRQNFGPRTVGLRGGDQCFLRGRMVDDMALDHASVREYDWVSGCYYLVRRELIGEVGFLDPRYFLYYEEIDHCRGAKRKRRRVIYFPNADVVHLGGESALFDGELAAGGRQLSALQVESELLYFRKQHGLAGAVTGVILQSMVQLWSGLKPWLRPGRATNAKAWLELQLLWRLALSTRLGYAPTR